MAAVTAPVPFMAVSLQQAPSSTVRGASVMSAKSDLQAAGRRKLDEFRAKAGKSKQAKNPAKLIEPVKRADSNGDVHTAVQDPVAAEVFLPTQQPLVQPLVTLVQPPVPENLPDPAPVEAALNPFGLRKDPVSFSSAGPVETRPSGAPSKQVESRLFFDSGVQSKQVPVDSSVPLKKSPVEPPAVSSVLPKQCPVETKPAVTSVPAPVEAKLTVSTFSPGPVEAKATVSTFTPALKQAPVVARFTGSSHSSSVHSSANFFPGVYTSDRGPEKSVRPPGYEERGKENLSSNIMDRSRDSSLGNSTNHLPRPDFTAVERPAVTSTNADGPLRSFTSLPMRDEFAAFDVDHAGSRKDEFATLEQHIEDLTQEKFTLQRGLDKARALVETLTQDNSALTEDYNQQGAKVNELKDEIASYHETIRSQEIFIKTLKAETSKAYQESTAATERARSFAAESVALEEKLLKTRSQELKLQKEVESLRTELESSRKQLSSIEKDRSNAISLNDALQEEKKLLLTRIREAASEKSSSLYVPAREDASTSTDDLVVEEEPANASVQTEEETTSYPTSIPSDHLGIIESINALVTELGQEKSEILRMLRNETSSVAQLKAENAELSQRLERQTQQLELAYAQSMARAVGASSSTVSPGAGPDEAEYMDEGDEVVDRVLGWIMRLFPVGSSRRGGSKQL